VFVRQSSGEKAQSLPHSFQNIGGFSIAVLVADAQAGEAKSRCRDAGHQPRVISVGQGAVLHLARVLARFIQKLNVAR
jgi:hypothetical protein